MGVGMGRVTLSTLRPYLVIAAWVSLGLFFLAAVKVQWLDANGFYWRFL
jgi:hypothetical protein